MDAPDRTRDNNLQAKDMQKRKRAWKPSALPQTHTTLTTIMRITIDFLLGLKVLSFIWPKRCGALGTILGMRREKLREALALSRAKTKVDLSRVTDSIESCI